MTVSTQRIIEGHEFEFVSDGCYSNEPGIVIPISTAEGLDERTFGMILQELIYQAYYAEAVGTADSMLQYRAMNVKYAGLIPPDILEEHAERIERMKKYVGLDHRIDQAINVVDISLEAARIKEARRVQVRTYTRQIRSDLQGAVQQGICRAWTP